MENMLVYTSSDIHFISTSKAINVYPNPASDILKIQSDTSVQRWTLYSLSGSCIATGSETTIDTSNIPSGTYLLKIQTEGKEFCYPVLIVHWQRIKNIRAIKYKQSALYFTVRIFIVLFLTEFWYFTVK